MKTQVAPGKSLAWKCIGSIVVILLFQARATAQLCTGSLGDPIVNIDFGSGSGRGAALGAEITAYTYSSGNDLGEGVYTIANTTSGLKNNAWLVTGDHTGNTNGYMMVVNSATLNAEGTFYKKTVSGLCPNTTYEFSAWLVNIMDPAVGADQYHPNITFRVSNTSGTVLGSYKTGEIAQSSTAQWKQYGFYFNTGTASNVVITILNSAPSARPGNDLALDDITFRACGASMKAAIKNSSASNYTLCVGSETELSLSAELGSGYTSPLVQWQKSQGSGWQDIDGLTGTDITLHLNSYSSGTYSFRASVAESANIGSKKCRVYSNQLNITLQDIPKALFELQDTLACAEHEVSFKNKSSSVAALNYYWQFGDGSSSNEQTPRHSYASQGSYTVSLKVSTDIGCADSYTLPRAVVVYTIPSSIFSVTPKDTSIYYPHVQIWLSNYNGGTCNLNWGDGTETSCNAYQHSYSAPGTYSITQRITNNIGCYNDHTEIVVIRDVFSVFVPNAFSPNGDGLNDVFLPITQAVSHYNFMVFDRWGKKVFESSDPQVGWDGYYNGSACMKGVYAYTLSLKDDVDQNFHQYKGMVLLYQWEWEDQ